MLSSRGSAGPATLRSGVAVLAVAVILAPSAVAKTNGTPVAVTAHAGDQATLTLSRAASRTLKNAHVSLQAVRPSIHRRSSFVLPTKSGRWNFTAADGTLNLGGGLRLKLGKRSQALGTVVFSRSANGAGQLTVKVHGKKIKVFDMAKKGAQARTSGTRQTVSKFSVTLTKQAAALINKALKHRVFRAKQKLGSFQVSVSTTAAKATPGAGGAAGAASTSGVAISFARAFQSIPGLSATPLGPALGAALGTLPGPLGSTPIPVADGTSVTLPLNGGAAGLSFSQGMLTGTLPLGGGIQLDNGNGSVSITNPTLTLGTGTEGSTLSASLNGGPAITLFNIDTSQLLQSATANGGLDLSGLSATLSSQGASSLNQLLGTSAFATAQPIGGLTVIVPKSPGS